MLKNMENMYEGKNIKIIIDGKKIEDIIIKKFVLNEQINDHKKLKLEFETEDAEKKKLEEIIKKEDVKLQIELENSQITKKIFKGVIDYFEILDYGSEGCKILIKAFSESIFFDRKLEKRYRDESNNSRRNFIKIIDRRRCTVKEYKRVQGLLWWS